ncbi:MAG: anti-sigma factor, partial [Gemmatimonadota bacterium]
MNDDRYRPGSEAEHAALARLVGAYVDRELAPDLHDRVQAHLNECEECRGAARIQTTIRTRLESLTPRGLPAEFRQRLLAGLESQSVVETEPGATPAAAVAPQGPARRGWLVRAAGLAGWLVAAVLAGVLLSRSTRNPAGMA